MKIYCGAANRNSLYICQMTSENAPGSPLSMEDQTLDYYRVSLTGQQPEITEVPHSFELDALKEFLKLVPPGGQLLDAGFGAGNHLAYFLSHGLSCDGFEGSQEVIDFTKAKLQKLLPQEMSRLKIWKADFRTLTLRRESYDGIWANQVFCHLPPPGCQRVMQAFFSALKPGGILYASFHQILEGSADEKFVHLEEHHEKNGQKLSRHFYTYPQQEFESMIRQSGFQPLLIGHDKENPSHCAVVAKRV